MATKSITSGRASSAGKSRKTATRKRASNGNGADKDAIALIKADHRKVQELFEQYEGETDASHKRETARRICNELIVHTMIEEEVFYPECREHDVEDDQLNEAQVEHDSAKALIAELIAGSPEDDEFFDAKVKVLKEHVNHHIQEEEKRGGILANAKKTELDLEEIGRVMRDLKEELTELAEEGELDELELRSLFHQRDLRQAGGRRQGARMGGRSGFQGEGRSSRYESDQRGSRRGYEQQFQGPGGYGGRSGPYADDDSGYGRRGQGGYGGGEGDYGREGYGSRGGRGGDSGRGARSRY